MDRETLIKRNAIHGLESAIELSNSMVHLRKEHAKAILELLKEQEAVEPKKESDDYPGSWWYVCGNCGGVIDWHDMYCRHCGQAVKWK